MSECGFCVGSWDEGDGEYFGFKVVRIRKERRCEECGLQFLVGTSMVYHKGVNDGRVWGVYCCELCDEIASAFSCNGRMFGEFWSSMWDFFPSLNTSCFQRLSTPPAKAELQRRWIDYKFNSYAAKREYEDQLKLLRRKVMG
jgi:hypothetical protein